MFSFKSDSHHEVHLVINLVSPSQVVARASFSAIFKADSACKTASIEVVTYNLNKNVSIQL